MAGINKAAVARRLGISRTAVAKRLARNPISPDTLARVAWALGIPEDDLRRQLAAERPGLRVRSTEEVV